MTPELSLGAWLTPARATAWCRVLAVAELIWVIARIAGSHGASGLLQTDFTPFWTAAFLTAHEGAAAIYDPVKMAAVEHSLEPMAANLVGPFLYPPSYLLLIRPLAALPPLAALAGFTIAGLAVYLLCLRRLVGRSGYMMAILAFPGVLSALGSGQNGLFAAACFGGGALFLERRPILAGFCLGALSCKPQLGVLVPIVLLAARRWRAFCGACACGLALIAVSAATFGVDAWRAFFSSARAAGQVLSSGLSDPARLQTVFGAARILHAPALLGWTCQAVMSLAAVSVLIGVARCRPGGKAEIAALVVATLAAIPYVMDYDLAALAVPLAWLFTAAQRDGWRPWERYGAVMAYAMPLLTTGIASTFGVPLAPALLAGFAAVIFARAAGTVSLAETPHSSLAAG